MEEENQTLEAGFQSRISDVENSKKKMKDDYEAIIDQLKIKIDTPAQKSGSQDKELYIRFLMDLG